MPVDEKLEQIARTLTAPASLAESRFLAIGQSLERAVGILARLVDLCQARLAELQSVELIQARQDLSAAATHIDLFAGTQQGDVAALEQLAGMAAALERRMAQMRDVGREVDVLAMNARLVAATMGEAGTDFLLFAGEIRRSAALAHGNLAQIGAELATAAEHLSVARSSVVSFAERNAEALRAIPRRLAANVAALDQRASLAGEATSVVAKRSEDVARHGDSSTKITHFLPEASSCRRKASLGLRSNGGNTGHPLKIGRRMMLRGSTGSPSSSATITSRSRKFSAPVASSRSTSVLPASTCFNKRVWKSRSRSSAILSGPSHMLRNSAVGSATTNRITW